MTKETGNLPRQRANYIVVPIQTPVEQDCCTVMCIPLVIKTSLKVERCLCTHHDVPKCDYLSAHFYMHFVLLMYLSNVYFMYVSHSSPDSFHHV